MVDDTVPCFELSSRRTEESHSRLRRRSPHLGRRRHAAVAGGAAPRDRRAAGPPDPGPPRSDPHHPQLRRHDPGPHLRDLLRLRGLRRSRRPAHRSRLQARLRTPARHRGRPVLAADPVAAGERPTPSRRDPPHLRPGGRLDGLLPAGARGGDARHRRYLRRRPRPSAAVAVQRPLRRALLPAHPRLRHGAQPPGRRRAAPGEDAVRRRGAGAHAGASSGTSEPAGRRPASCCAATATTPGPSPWRGARPTACSTSSACRARSRCRGRSRTPPTPSAPSVPSATSPSCGPTPKPGTGPAPGTGSVAPWRASRRPASASTSASSSPTSSAARPSGSTTACIVPRGQAENLIKLHKSQLRSDRTSCRSALANQVRLVLHTAAYWLMLDVRDAIPKSPRPRQGRVHDVAPPPPQGRRQGGGDPPPRPHRFRGRLSRGRSDARPDRSPDPAPDLSDGAEPLTPSPVPPAPHPHRRTDRRRSAPIEPARARHPTTRSTGRVRAPVNRTG